MAAIELFQELVRQASVFEREHGAVTVVEQELDRLGIERLAVPFDASRLRELPDAQPPFSSIAGRRNIVARLSGTGGGRSIVLNCHLDVVPASDAESWSDAPFSGSVRDGVLFGRGSYDDKAGAVVCLAVLERVKGNPLPGNVTAHFVLEDETTGNGSLLCLESGFGADGAIIIDGTRGDRGINQHAGNIRFGVTMAGRTASVSVSHMGLNAAELLNELLAAIRKAIFALNDLRIEPWSVFPSPNQFSILGQLCQETALTVPVLATATCYATFTPPLDLAAFRRMVERIGTDFTQRYKLPSPPTFDWSNFAAESVCSSSRDLEATISRAANRMIPFGPSTGTSDMRHFVQRGIPCVLFGPGVGYNPHRPNECFHLDSLRPMVDTIYKTVAEWCG
jgi:acetylornithine deacetylase